MGMVNCNGLDNPVGGKEATDEEEVQVKMEPNDAWKFCRSAARVNYMAQDRPDLGKAAQKLSQWMSNPSVGDNSSGRQHNGNMARLRSQT